MNKANSVARNLDFHSNPEVNYPFIAEAQFVSARSIARARQILDRLTDDMQQAVIQSREQTLLGKLNAALWNFYEHRPELLRYAVPTRNFLFTDQLLGNGPGQIWFASYMILFNLKAKMQTVDAAWADLNLVSFSGEVLLEYRGEYYTNEFDTAIDPGLVQTRTSRPNDGFSSFLKIKDKADILHEFDISAQNAEQILRPLQERQIEFLDNILLAFEMDAKGYARQFKEYLLKAHEVYPCLGTTNTLLNIAVKEEDYKEIIRYASEILERFGCTTGEKACDAYHNRAVSYLALQDYENAEKDMLVELNLAQNSGDAEKILNIYDSLVHLACDLKNVEKIVQYATARLNLGVDDPTCGMELHMNLGIAYSYPPKTDWVAAKEHLLTAHKIAKQLNNQQMLANINIYLTNSAINGNIYDDELLEIAVENFDNINSYPFHWYIGQFNFGQQNYVEARKHFSLALNQLRATGQFDNAVLACLWLARTAAKQGDYPETLRKAQEGLKLNNNFAHDFLYLHSALAYLVLGETKNAEKAFASALDLFRQNGDFDSDAEGDLQTAKEFLLKQGRQDDAAKVNDWLAQLKQTKP
ncbi:MAG: hypothetical protein LBK68_03285 [Candidatus Margulisbacteria bacterium]|jgi:hypothetical protein|nr:hypothetical protein [Candidatus Margulisiibacteriota bacterium]